MIVHSGGTGSSVDSSVVSSSVVVGSSVGSSVAEVTFNSTEHVELNSPESFTVSVRVAVPVNSAGGVHVGSSIVEPLNVPSTPLSSHE